MQLRRIIKPPARYEDGEATGSRRPNGTKPAYPAQLKAQIVPFNPDHPPAAFPSLPLTAQQPITFILHIPLPDLSKVPAGLTSLSEKSLGKTFVDATDPVEPPYAPHQNPDSHGHFIATNSASEIDGNHDTQDMISTTSHQPSTVHHGSDEKDVDPPSWNSLPLSLKYHIFTSLSEQNSSGASAKMLGLTELETSEIQAAVSLRQLHPASLSEIWDYCSRNDARSPGLRQPASYIDPAVLSTFMDYMLFACKYDFAYASEVQSAADFLLLCALPVELLGLWLPEPDEVAGGAPMTHVSGMLRKHDDSREGTQFDSSYSSLAQPDHTDDDGECNQNIQGADSTADQNSGDSAMMPKSQLTLQSAPARGRKKGQAKQNSSKGLRPKSKKKKAVHPLAIVAMSGESPSPPRSSRKDTETTDDEVEQSNTAITSDPGPNTRDGLFKKLNIDTRMSSFSKRLLTDDISDMSMAPQSTVPSKRKPSPPDIRPSLPKIHRTSASTYLKTAQNYGLNNGVTLSIEPQIQNSSDTSFYDRVERPQDISSGLLRSPSYSPISENEDLQEFQALLRGPDSDAPSLHLRTANPRHVGGFDSGLSPTPRSVRNDDEAKRTLIAPLPADEEHGLPPDPTVKRKLTVRLLLKVPVPRTPGATNQQNKLDGMHSESPDHLSIDDAGRTSSKAVHETINKEGMGKETPAPRTPTTKNQSDKDCSAPGTAAAPKSTPSKRGPRGPYRKTRERLARAAANAQQAIS